MILKKRIIFLVLFLGTTFLVSSIYSNYSKERQFKRKIYFEVSKVIESKSFRCYYYNKEGQELSIHHTFYSPSQIKVGDIITKDSDSNELIIYRNDSIKRKTKFKIIVY